MQILSAAQIQAWDQFTICNEPVSSTDLMERAASRCVEWIQSKNWQQRPFYIFCGKGNNGGDGLAIARLLLSAGYKVSVYILEFGRMGSSDFQVNLHRLHDLPSASICFLQTTASFPAIGKGAVLVDALFGTGLNKPLEGLAADLVKHLNAAETTRVSIDLPSGLFTDRTTQKKPVIQADFTLTFQVYKPSLLVQENAPVIGEVQVLDIGLHPDFLQQLTPSFHLIDEKMIRQRFRPRNRFSHKGSFGHALLVGGSFGKIGAMVLAARACLHSGAGLTTVLIPRCGYTVLQTTVPEAMTVADTEEEYLRTLPDEADRFTAIGLGPGMGTKTETQNLLLFFIRRSQKPLVLDADALNILSQNQEYLTQLPSHSILTPHPKEFDRLFGHHDSDFARIDKAVQKAAELNVIIVLKGHHSFVATPGGFHSFNSTGNAGMAKGGSGDVLTGMITSLLAQGYRPDDAALLGVYLHGWAGDFAAKARSEEAMLPSDLIHCLTDVFQALKR